jgi:RNA polymerase sigma-70 factor (ECF subfamily)
VALRAEEISESGVVDLDRDRALVLRYQRGDEGAFDELYRRYYPRLHLYCQRRVGDPHVSEELAQEAFLRALRAMPRFAGERRFYPWMTVIAQRLCIDHHRRTARVEPAAEVDLGVVDEGHDHLYAQVDRGHLGEAISRLAPRHREVLSLREEKGWSYQQIAQHLDVPVTTIEALLHRARKALKREFLAVSGGTRLAGIPVLGWAVMRVARLRSRFSGRTAMQLAPIAGSAAAGVAAIGLVFNPLGAAADARPSVRPAAVAAHSTSFFPALPGDLTLPTDPAATTTPTTARATMKGGSSGSIGAVSVYHGAAGTQAAQAANSEQPVQIDLGVVQAGVNPSQTVGDLAKHIPGGKP